MSTTIKVLRGTEISKAVGTSFYGHEILTSVAELREAIGIESLKQNDGKDKVNFEWMCETSEGDIFTIYDWKEYCKIKTTGQYHFHIGAKNEKVAEKALLLLTSKLSSNA